MFKSLIFILTLFSLTACIFETRSSEAIPQPSQQLILATTTSTYDSGLLDELIPLYQDETGIEVKIISVGSGQALAMAESGEADVLLVHAPSEEENLEKEGIVINRHRVMHNDYVLLGPTTDPAETKDSSIEDALISIIESDAPFYSRADDSGTHLKELELWKDTGITTFPDAYQETGQGMGNTLRITAEKNGYTLTDRGTFLYLQDSLDPLGILVQGDESLENIYHVMQVHPDQSDQINTEAAETFINFFIRKDIQLLIKSYGFEEWGEPLFFPYLVD
ncbi:tungsten ABC transporter substrate-binding protein [Salipaludibacillus keqinensis]|uniref:Tungsten ABC transporter substrate-binding protein n=1 Tax=Salipaludibacillus keqinensis TaxID=2045207 RepID=A0A323TGW6_9BACI|nr:substrate-binding domain-containing protein [Salipaludibacillus keqinensis]PYZ94068.1 tungsten ABC transporter substrate-binding protein [Salipaludibacillus keqinensis]